MTQREDIRFYIENAEQMAQLGQLFGACYVNPLLAPEAPAQPIVVALYGPVDSGKTTFALGMPDVPGALARSYREAQNVAFSNKTPSGLSLRYVDQGYCTYPDERRWPKRGDVITAASRISLLETELKRPHETFVRVKEGERGLDIIEHAALPHVLRADVAIAISSTSDYKDNVAYYSRLMRATRNSLCKPPERPDQYPYSTWDLSRLTQAHRFFTTDMAELLRSTNHLLRWSRPARVVQFSFFSQEKTGPMRESSEAFLQKAAAFKL